MESGCKNKNDCIQRTLNSVCNELELCVCDNGYKYFEGICIPSIQFGTRCGISKHCRRWDSNLECNSNLCVCKPSFTFSIPQQRCLRSPMLKSNCPEGYTWNGYSMDCEYVELTPSSEAASDKLIDVVIVILFFIVLLLVIKKWRPTYQAFNRDLQWTLRDTSRNSRHESTVLFISTTGPTLWSSSSSSSSEMEGSSHALIPPPPPRYTDTRRINLNNIFEPQDPPPTYEEAMVMASNQNSLPSDNFIPSTVVVSRTELDSPKVHSIT